MVTTLAVQISWHAGALPDPKLRARLTKEIHDLSITLNAIEALYYDQHVVASGQHAFLMPCMELRLPLYDAKRRFTITLIANDDIEMTLRDEDGRPLAELRMP